MDSDLDLISAKAMLEWVDELGISEAISEKPINRFNTKADENAKIRVPRSVIYWYIKETLNLCSV